MPPRAPKVVVSRTTGDGIVSTGALYPTAQQIRRWRRRRLDHPLHPVPPSEVVWEDEDGRMYGPTNKKETTWYVYTPTKKTEDDVPLHWPPLDEPIRLIRAYDIANRIAIAYGEAVGQRRLLRLTSMTQASFGKLRYRTHEYNAEAGGIVKFKGTRKL